MWGMVLQGTESGTSWHSGKVEGLPSERSQRLLEEQHLYWHQAMFVRNSVEGGRGAWSVVPALGGWVENLAPPPPLYNPFIIQPLVGGWMGLG